MSNSNSNEAQGTFVEVVLRAQEAQRAAANAHVLQVRSELDNAAKQYAAIRARLGF